MKFSKELKIIIGAYLAATVFWIYFLIKTGYTSNELGLYLQIPLAIVPFLGGVFGLLKARKWGFSRSIMGRSLIGLSAGMLTWSMGMVLWNYYIFFTEVEIPYPSFTDMFFILSWPLWAYGVYELSKVAGAGFGLRLKNGKWIFLLIPFLVALFSYYLLFVVARGGQIDLESGGLKLFVDLFYPLGDIVIFTSIALAYSLSRKFLGGTYKPAIILLFSGFVLNYLTDFIFAYTTTIGTYFNGHFVDFMYTTTMFILAFAINIFDPDIKK